MPIRAKFHCYAASELSEEDPAAGTHVRLHAVYGDGSDNAAWSAVTPNGTLEMSITNPGAAGALVVGQDYYLDLTPVADAASTQRDYPDEVKVGDVIDPVPEAGHDGPQVVTAVTDHPDGTALELRPATPEEIAAQPAPQGTYLGSMSPDTAVYLQEPAPAASPAASPAPSTGDGSSPASPAPAPADGTTAQAA